ncbi:hypothetical protein [Acidovorax sp. PRC11]|uniref:hypothetical protein n=1 Tax=Acidovorax sp. PRC11 TaxID=2962592 RepID=UPI0028820582|nr:hypothetical protein [Acidovorax sp. PRC11]MDT0137718.1 hypothetical protein [Acidovorax sp. PRC11]
MLIKFKKPDPRAGMTARMDSIRGQQLIDAGSADRLPENGEAPREVPPPAAPPPAPAEEPAAAPAAAPEPAKPTRGRK